MRFVFTCHVREHVSGRVTVTPLEQPALAVHAASLERAVEELTLALDDQLGRAHPGRLFDLARHTPTTAAALAVPALRVHGEAEAAPADLSVHVVVGPAHRPYHEVRAPRLDVRLWLAGKDPAAQATPLLAAELVDRDEGAVLALRPDGPERFLDLELELTPLRLRDLRRSELDRDERAAPELVGPDEPDGGDASARAELDDDWDDDPRRRRARARPAARRPPATPTLDRLAVPWHQLAQAGGLEAAHHRDELVELVRARLAVAEPEPLVLVGPAGAGKTAILHELARRLAAAAPAAPPAPATSPTPSDPATTQRPVLFLDGSRLIAGQGYFGDWQRQTLDALREARAVDAVLVLGHLGELLDAGKSAQSDDNLAQLLAPILASREVAIVGEATAEEWALAERRNQGFARAFAVVRVDEPDPTQTRRILGAVAAELAAREQVVVPPDVVDQVLALCARFLPYGALVGNTVTLLRRLVEAQVQLVRPALSRADVLARFASETGIPHRVLDDQQPLREEEVVAFLAARVTGQDEAVARVARVVSLLKANLTDRRRPVASLFFVGPTGVGKTELAKALAELLFGSRERMVRIDLGELAGPDALHRLLGDGVHPGQLTEPVRRQPFSVILLDEIEKAHPVVFDALLGVLGEGRLTDAAGRLADFRASVIVCTSNLGAEARAAGAGTGFGAPGGAARARHQAEHYRAEVQRFFRPELFNRLDDIVVFGSLGAAEVAAIVERELAKVTRRDGLRHHRLGLEVTPAARALLAERGLDPRYGARPLKRTLERLLVAPVAAWIADHPRGGASTLVADVDARGQGLVLRGEAGLDADAGPAVSAALARIEQVLGRAAAVRAEVRQWARSPAMRRLVAELALFDRSSRQPAFWHDRDLADSRARAAAAARELVAGFAALDAQAVTTEDLAYEAYYRRELAAADGLSAEIAQVDNSVVGLGERLFASLFPPRGAVSLTLHAARTGWNDLTTQAGVMREWAMRRGASVSWYEPIAVYDGPVNTPAKKARGKARPDATADDGARAGARAAPSRPPDRWTWSKVSRPSNAPPDEPCLIMVVSGGQAMQLLAAEHGAHRVTRGGSTAVVRVRFRPEGLRPSNEVPAALDEEALTEVRRWWPDKGVCFDVRLRRNFPLGHGGGPDLAPMLGAYLRWRVLGDHDDGGRG